MIFWMQSLISKVTSTSPGIPAPVRYKSSQSARVCWSANTPKGISSEISKSRGFRLDPVVNTEHINTIGQALNCIINDLNWIPTENGIQIMQNNMNNGTSKVQSMAGGYINNDYKIINDIIH